MRKINRVTVLLILSILVIFTAGFTLDKAEAYVYASSGGQSESYLAGINIQGYGNSTSIVTGNKDDSNDNNNGTKEDINIDDLGGTAKGQIEGLYDYINKMKTDVELMEYLNPKDYIQSYISEGKGNLSIDVLAKAALSLCFKEVKSVLALVISIITIAIICALLKIFRMHLWMKVHQRLHFMHALYLS